MLDKTKYTSLFGLFVCEEDYKLYKIDTLSRYYKTFFFVSECTEK